MGKRATISAAIAVLLVVTMFAVLAAFPFPPLGRIFMAAGFPLGALLLHLMPESFLHGVVPGGGPDAVGWVFALSTLLTWFIMLFVACFLAMGRMRSNHTVETDARKSSARGSP